MKTVTIKLDEIEKVKRFVNIVSRFDGDYDLASKRYVVDAKSIMGIFSLDLGSPLELNVHNEDEYDVITKELESFIVK